MRYVLAFIYCERISLFSLLLTFYCPYNIVYVMVLQDLGYCANGRSEAQAWVRLQDRLLWKRSFFRSAARWTSRLWGGGHRASCILGTLKFHILFVQAQPSCSCSCYLVRQLYAPALQASRPLVDNWLEWCFRKLIAAVAQASEDVSKLIHEMTVLEGALTTSPLLVDSKTLTLADVVLAPLTKKALTFFGEHEYVCRFYKCLIFLLLHNLSASQYDSQVSRS